MNDSTRLRALGLMSGTSMDGIDVALLDTDGIHPPKRGPARTYPYEPAFQQRLDAAMQTAKAIVERVERPGDLAAIEREITDRHADAVGRFIHETGIDPASIDVVGFHGQTVLHRPHEALTIQLGDGQRLATALGCTVIHDMRAADMLAGGQGAPLVPAYHAALAAALPSDMREMPVVFVNIGGISNITYLDADAEPIAFDTGPGNALLDQWVSRHAGIPFDQNGTIASEGGIIDGLAAHYLGSAFFGRTVPKSLDRFDFQPPTEQSGSLEDVARTLCFVAAQAILKAAEHLPKPPALWVVCGGGRRHPAIMHDLRHGAAERGARVVSAEEAGFDGDAMEAEAWAFLAVRSLRNLPLTWPTTTGCHAPTPGGVVAAPDRVSAKPH